MIKPEYEKADTDGLYYQKKDTEWLVHPNRDDPGVIGPKPGAVPVLKEEATEQ